MQRHLAILFSLFLPMTALADGAVIRHTAFALQDKINIPDQRAILFFSDKTERLVIETRFTGPGTNFAWIVPLPSQPVIEEARREFFPRSRFN